MSSKIDWMFTYLQLNIIRMYKQLQYFEQYQQRVRKLIGPAQTNQLVNQAVVLITVGGNDFVNNYYLVPYSSRSRQFSLPDYIRYVLSEYEKLLMVIYFLRILTFIHTHIVLRTCVHGRRVFRALRIYVFMQRGILHSYPFRGKSHSL